MFKLLLVILGFAGGAAGAIAWLLSEPGSETVPPRATADGLQVRLDDVKARFREAMAEGEQAGTQTEQRLRRELAAYRKNPDRPAVS